MKFYTCSKTARPVRLSEETRRFAYDSIYKFKYGLQTEACGGVSLEDVYKRQALIWSILLS